jgi:hypothetical protein
LYLLPPSPPSFPKDDLGVILSSCQRLGVAPSTEWQDILAQAFLSTIDTPEKAESVRSDYFVKPLVGLAGMGWKPTPEQWQVVLQASEVLLPLGYLKARQLLETAWAMAQFGTPVPQQWGNVSVGWSCVCASCWELPRVGMTAPQEYASMCITCEHLSTTCEHRVCQAVQSPDTLHHHTSQLCMIALAQRVLTCDPKQEMDAQRVQVSYS